jgi:tryptophan synthase alpha chain
MSRIDDVFAGLRAEGRKAFVPFVTAGDPGLKFTAAVLDELGRRGATICEVGIPYSDPLADGPVIQASYTRALDRDIRLQAVLETLREVSARSSAPLVTMVSYSVVHRHGPRRYIEELRRAGVSGAIVPDMPVEESGPLAELCRQADLSLIQLVTPTTPRERALRIAQSSTGFLYYVSVTGITGERTELPPEIVDNVAWLREQTRLPICIGFGISRPEQARMLAPVADGIIVGSAIVRRIAQAATRPHDEVLADVGDYAASLVAALATEG